MPLNLSSLIFLLVLAQYISSLVLNVLKKTRLLNVNISTFSMLLELCFFSHLYLFDFGLIVFSLLLISLTVFQCLYSQTQLLFQFYTALMLIILWWGSLVAYVMLQLWQEKGANSIQELYLVSLLAILLALKGTDCLTLRKDIFYIPEMFFMKMFFIFKEFLRLILRQLKLSFLNLCFHNLHLVSYLKLITHLIAQTHLTAQTIPLAPTVLHPFLNLLPHLQTFLYLILFSPYHPVQINLQHTYPFVLPLSIM